MFLYLNSARSDWLVFISSVRTSKMANGIYATYNIECGMPLHATKCRVVEKRNTRLRFVFLSNFSRALTNTIYKFTIFIDAKKREMMEAYLARRASEILYCEHFENRTSHSTQRHFLSYSFEHKLAKSRPCN